MAVERVIGMSHIGGKNARSGSGRGKKPRGGRSGRRTERLYDDERPSSSIDQPEQVEKTSDDESSGLSDISISVFH